MCLFLTTIRMNKLLKCIYSPDAHCYQTSSKIYSLLSELLTQQRGNYKEPICCWKLLLNVTLKNLWMSTIFGWNLMRMETFFVNSGQTDRLLPVGCLSINGTEFERIFVIMVLVLHLICIYICVIPNLYLTENVSCANYKHKSVECNNQYLF